MFNDELLYDEEKIKNVAADLVGELLDSCEPSEKKYALENALQVYRQVCLELEAVLESDII